MAQNRRWTALPPPLEDFAYVEIVNPLTYDEDIAVMHCPTQVVFQFNDSMIEQFRLGLLTAKHRLIHSRVEAVLRMTHAMLVALHKHQALRTWIDSTNPYYATRNIDVEYDATGDPGS